MFIRKVDRFYRKQDGTLAAYDYYHLTKSYRDAKGKKHNRCVLGMGRLEEFTERERDELADMLTVMIEKGQCVMHEDRHLYEKAMELYAEYRESKYAKENDPILIAEAERKKLEAMRDAITIKISSLTQHEARSIGCENLCHLLPAGHKPSSAWKDKICGAQKSASKKKKKNRLLKDRELHD